jgi:hypothetical protein
MTRTLLTALVLLAALAAPASAARVPLPPQLTVHAAECPDGGGSCSYTASPDIYLAPGTGASVRFHEIGHQFDRQVLTDADRAWFIRLFDDGTTWGEVEETFANAYAACAVQPFRIVRRGGMRVYESTLEFEYMPTVREYRRACNAIAVIGLVRGTAG